MMLRLSGPDSPMWASNLWCVAVLQLCGQYEAAADGVLTRYPEQWVYFLWKPSGRAVPHREPDCMGFAVGNPLDDIKGAIGDAPFYLLKDEECNWPTWLEIAITCEDLEDWIYDLVADTLRKKRMAAREAWMMRYSLD